MKRITKADLEAFIQKIRLSACTFVGIVVSLGINSMKELQKIAELERQRTGEDLGAGVSRNYIPAC